MRTSHLLVTLLAFAAAAPAGAATVRRFDSGAWIIPMDACYQRTRFMSDGNIKTIFGWSTAQFNARKCLNNNEGDEAYIDVYGMVIGLVQAGVKVSWVIASPKAGPYSIDFSIVAASPARMRKWDGSYDSRWNDITIGRMDFVGGPFVIDKADVDKARAVLATLNADGGFGGVNLFEALAPFDAPVYREITAVPKLAIVDMRSGWSQDKTNFVLGYPDDAELGPRGAYWDLVSGADLLDGRLARDGFQLVWVPPAELGGATPTAYQQQVLDQLDDFADHGGHVVFLDSMVATVEGHGSSSSGMTTYAQAQAPITSWQTTGGIVTNGISSTWGSNDSAERTGGDDYSDPLGQYGGITWTGLGGGKYNWKPRPGAGGGYKSGVHRPLYSEHFTNPANPFEASDGWDFATWRYHGNDESKGKIIYIGGFHMRDVTAAGFRVLLNTLLADGIETEFPEDLSEVTRSSPVLARIGDVTAQVQGTFLTMNPVPQAHEFFGASSADTFRFPSVLGHMRAIDVAQISTTLTEFNALGAPLFDAAEGLPAARGDGCGIWFDGSCRTVFTNLPDGDAEERVFVSTEETARLAPYLAPDLSSAEVDTLIARLLAGHKVGNVWVPRLGGVDRSTVAVIGASPVLETTRPTMVYFGALDGMLHAVCATRDAGTGCDAAGRELWAFLPRTQLYRVRRNDQALQGSPRVADVFALLPHRAAVGVTHPEWRTVLVVQTGNGRAGGDDAPAAYALDVTDPGDPQVMWERATPRDRGSFALGAGLDLALGPVRTASGLRYLAFLSTNNGGVGPAGVLVSAIDVATGEDVWSWSTAYPGPRVDSNANVPGTGVPAGPSAVDAKGTGTLDRVVVPTLYGDVFVLDAATGANVFGEAPLFRFGSDFHPIGAAATIYRDPTSGKLHLAVVSGGYTDENTSWAPENVAQWAVGIALAPPAGATLPLDERSGAPAVSFALSLGVGQRVYAQALVAGNDLFLVTDPADANSSAYGLVASQARLLRISLTSGAAVGDGAPVAGGASSVDVAGAAVYVSSGADASKIAAPSLDSAAASTELGGGMRRKVWLRLR